MWEGNKSQAGSLESILDGAISRSLGVLLRPGTRRLRGEWA